MSGISVDPCANLEWDTAFWGFPIARVQASTITEDQMRDIDAWCNRNKIRCLYFLARMDDSDTIYLAERYAFHLTDIRNDFRYVVEQTAPRPGTTKNNGVCVRHFRSEDAKALRTTARESYHDTRFYFDRHFPRQQCDLLYETWIQRSWEGYADAVLVAVENSEAIGFVTCHVDRSIGTNPTGRIGLVGVTARARGHGVGQLLTSAAVGWFVEQRVQEIFVATQVRNIPAQRLYQRCGFITYSAHLWYHKWYAISETDK